MKAAVVVAAILVVGLAGCATPTLPPGLTPAEAKAIIAEQNERWWHDMFPNEEPPLVDPVEFVPVENQARVSQQCATEANLAGLAESMHDSGESVQDRFNRAFYVCTLSHPLDFSDPSALGFYSPEQVDYLNSYYSERLIPCLRLLGYTIPDQPAQVGTTGPDVSPYWSLDPVPGSAQEWHAIDLRCPPPPIGPTWERGF